jgi:proton-dependent oligopeptide transporter, POT family
MTTDARAAADAPVRPFPRTFWSANVTELFERAAYYAMASFVVIYLGQLGLGGYWPSRLNSSVLWTLVYFLPILSGTIADQVGFRRSLLVAFVLLGAGYFLLGYPVWFGGAHLDPAAGQEVTAGAGVIVPVVIGVFLIGIGGSIVKPTISGTVQKSNVGRATLAFAIFYMVINIGSLLGRIVAYLFRHRPGMDLSAIFGVGAFFSAVAFVVVLFVYREPAKDTSAPAKPPRPIGRILVDMVLVLRNRRFALFLAVTTGFWFIYNQVYNILPLWVSKVVQRDPPMEIYTAFNPLTIVLFQLLVTRLFGGMKPIRSIVVGTVIIGLAMAVNVFPLLTGAGLRDTMFALLPFGALFVVLTVSLIAFGELFTSARMYEWVGALAPKGEEGLFLGYVSLPVAIGSWLSGIIGPVIFNDLMIKGATVRPDGLLDPVPARAIAGWLILMGIGLASALATWIYHVWLERHALSTPGPA